MKKLIFLLLITYTSYGQQEYLNQLVLYGSNELGITPSEKIWIAESSGHTYHTDKFDEPWFMGPFDTINQVTGTFERVTCFSDKVLMISGLLSNYEERDPDKKMDFVYRSENGGMNWDRVDFGGNGWMDAIYSNDNGNAWMSGSSGYIYYTNDTGKTWTTLNGIKSETDFRVQAIHFSPDKSIGLFGSLEGELASTKDNCATSLLLPTPLSQKKLKNVNGTRASIPKVRIFGNYFIVKQLGEVFTTKSTTINWEILDNAIDYEITEQGVYVVNSDLTVELKDRDFKTIWKSERKLNNYPVALSVKNNNLFAITRYHIYRINPSEFGETLLVSANSTITEPHKKLDFENEQIGFEEEFVLKFNKKSNSWYRYMQVPFYITNATVYDGKIVAYQYMPLQHYTIDIDQKKAKPFTIPELSLGQKEIKKFTVEKGSSGCFHSWLLSKEYDYKNGVFKAGKQTGEGQNFKQMDNTITAQLLKDITLAIDSSRHKSIKWNDLEITAEDIRGYRKLISRMRGESSDYNDYNNPYRNLNKKNYDFYNKSTDSLAKLSTVSINNIFKEDSGMFSTTTNWNKLRIEFTDNTSVSILNNDYRPNYLNTPWMIEYEGLLLKSNSIKLGQLINKLTKGGLFKETQIDKKYAIYQIIDYMYKQSIKEKTE